MKKEIENNKEAELNNKIINFYNKINDSNITDLSYYLFDNDVASYGYLERLGYYIIKYDSWHNYILNNYGEDINSIFIELAKSIINKESHLEEYKNSRMINKSYRKKYPDIKYSNSIYKIDYALDKWSKYYDNNIPDEIIYMYQSYIDIITGINKEQVLEYDKNTNRFIYINKPKTKKLIKY